MEKRQANGQVEESKLTYIDMNDIARALRSINRRLSMDELGFDYLEDSNYLNDEYYIRRNMALIVYFSPIDGIFKTYPYANKKEVGGKKVSGNKDE